ncbi:MAG: F0F1 ATP synthase subunit delta [Spirochaetaceae bacterium]|nr:F0F1 ATP synthase subunit delta [Spirochaetaceae bacterium]
MGDSRRAWARALFAALPDPIDRERCVLALEGAASALAHGSGTGAEAFFEDPVVSKEAKAEALASLFPPREGAPLAGSPRAGLRQAGAPGAASASGPDQAAAAYSRFAALLVEKRRLPLLPAIAEVFRGLLDREDRVVRVTVVSARPLSDADLDRIGAVHAAEAGARRAIVSSSVDPALLGGFTLLAGNVRSDWSTAGRLARLRGELSRPLDQGRA